MIDDHKIEVGYIFSTPVISELTNRRLGLTISRIILWMILFIFCSFSVIAQEKKVLIISIDGLLPEVVGSEDTPNINTLFQKREGFLTYGYTEDLTFSGPSWSSVLHGVHRDRHGVDTNQYDGHDFSDYPNFLKRLKNYNADFYTAAFVTWPLLQNNFRSPDGTYLGVDKLVFHSHRYEGDEKVTEDLISLLKTGSPDGIFYYQNDIDAAGHSYGFSVDISEYRQQVRLTDSRIGRVLDVLHAREEVNDGREDWFIMLVTDHGGVGTGHSGNLYRQRFIPLIVSGRSAGYEKPAIRSRNVDVSRTVLSWMGIPKEEFTDLDGQNILAMDQKIPKTAFGKNLVVNPNGDFDRGFAGQDLDQAISGWRDQEMTGHKDGFHSMTVIRPPSDIVYVDGDGTEVDGGGSNLFTGGRKGTSSRITQRIDLTDFRDEIDKRNAFYRLGAFLGGSGDNADRMKVTAKFFNKDGNLINTGILDAVTRKERNGKTQLKYREIEGLVFSHTHYVIIEMNAIACSKKDIGNQALADKISFELYRNKID